MAHVAAWLKRQKEEELAKEKERLETSKIYAEYVRDFEGTGAPATAVAATAPVRFVKSGEPAPKPSQTSHSSLAASGIFDAQAGGDPAAERVDEHSAEYLRWVTSNANAAAARPPATGKTQLKEKQQRQEEEKALQRRMRDSKLSPGLPDAAVHSAGVDPRRNSGSDAPCTIYVGNLPPSITEDDLERKFGRCGRINRIKVMRSSAADRPKQCYAFVTFSHPSDAQWAKESLDGAEILGYRCRLGWSYHGGGRSPTHGSSPSSYAEPAEVAVSPMPSSSNLPPLLADARGVHVELPPSPMKRAVIDLMARYVVQGGAEFEAMIMANESEQGLFNFIFNRNSPEHIYYRWKVYSLLQGDTDKEWRREPFQVVAGGLQWHPPVEKTDTSPAPPMPTVPPILGAETAMTMSHSGRAPMMHSDISRLEKLLRDCTTTRGSVAEAMMFIINHGESAFQVTDYLVNSILEDTPTVDKKISRLYILSDVLYNTSASNKFAWLYRSSFEKRIPEVFAHFRQFMKTSSSKIAVQQLIGSITRMLPAWRQWNAYPTEYIHGLESALWGPDFESFATLPHFEEHREAIDSTYDGEKMEYFDVLSRFPLKWREAAYRYLLMRVRKLKQLCLIRGLLTIPGDRSSLVTRLIINDMYVEAREAEIREMELAERDNDREDHERLSQSVSPYGGADTMEMEVGSGESEMRRPPDPAKSPPQPELGDAEAASDECSDVESASDAEVPNAAASESDDHMDTSSDVVGPDLDHEAPVDAPEQSSEVAAEEDAQPEEVAPPAPEEDPDDIEDMFAADN
ncbi:surp module family protein, putative [Babesia bigemina]|uniref:Surp module family protein, putative n=1 Tax=Babesia bigemina TaxID=5866 RepID=A0A061DEH4_BABBI|nr:surp module family protein, putative [Babesia bigemina]CDR97285.1 surp module family protein, putative [Babesia bigemina]|eukprot:XP_012769471.1 surp module family protein, putative [Babesia bigemina]